MNTSSFSRRGRRAALAAVMGLAAMALSAPLAGAAVTPSANDPETGFPFSYTDDVSGVTLGLCVDGPPLCLNTPRKDPDKPASVPDNFPPDGEAFWWEAEASLTTGRSGKGLLVLAREAAFDTLGGAPAAGHQISFGRIRVKATGLVPGATYTITHPYGLDTAVADARGTIFTTEDGGCLAAPCLFASAPPSRVTAFLQWDPTVAPAPPAGYIGDAASEHTVIGSPNDTNFFRIDGPDAGGPGVNSVRTDLFVVQGQLAGAAPAAAPRPILDTRSISFPSRQVGAPSAAKTVTVSNHGTAADRFGSVSVGGTDGADFTVTADTCSGQTIAPADSCSVSVVFSPTATGDRAATLSIPDTSTRSPNVVTLSGVATPGPAPAPIIIITNPAAGAAKVAGATASRPRALRALGVSVRPAALRLAQARRSGIRVRFTVPAKANIARAELFRGKRRIASSTVRGSGVKTISFRRGLTIGRYSVRIRVAASAASLASASAVTRSARITR